VRLSRFLWPASILIAEVFLVSALYRRLRVAEKEHWLGNAIPQNLVACIVDGASAGSRRLGA
jgi:hypothetical protein